MMKFIRIGVDLGKRYFQVHALLSEDGRAVTRKLRTDGAEGMIVYGYKFRPLVGEEVTSG